MFELLRLSFKVFAFKIITILFLCFVVFCILGHFFLTYNTSRSMPIGLYIRVGKKPTKYALVCLKGEASQYVRTRGLPTHGGSCPDHTYPLLKMVYTTGVVEYNKSGIVVNGEHIKNTRPFLVDSEGNHMSHYPFGSYTISNDELWAISDYNPLSYDSRYFGPVKKSQVLSYVYPFIVW